MKIRSRLALALGLFAAVLSAHALEWEATSVERTPAPGAEIIRVQYRFRNVSGKTVNITGITTSCGCTEANVDDTAIRAGASGAVKVLFTVGQRTGTQRKSIYVQTDERAAPSELELVVKLPAERAGR